MYKLSETQCNYSKEQISAIIDQEVTEMTERNQVIYKTKYLEKIL